MKNTIIVILVIALVVLGIYFFTSSPTENKDVIEGQDLTKDESDVMEQATTTVDKTKTIIGASVEGREITAYHFGEGVDEILFVGGIHGGYGWNTALVAYELMDHLKANSSVIPSNVKVTVVPVLNPDGLTKVVGTSDKFTKADVSKDEAVVVAGRFNAHTVDLNRNFDCDWQANGKWQTKTVSGGSQAFSEPESQAIKSYVEANKLKAVIVWYSAAGGVFASSCHNGVSAETTKLTKIFADASGYKPYQSFDFYAITGDMVNWLAKNNIPAISVLLTNHTDTEFTKNQKGIEAILQYYSAPSSL